MRRVLICALAMLLPACSVNYGSLRIASSKNLPIEPAILKTKATGKDCMWSLLGMIPLGKLNPNVEAAMNSALEQAPEANALTNVNIYQDVLFALVVTELCFRVEGDAVKIAAPK